MNLTDYKNIINQTAVFPKQVDNFGLAYCILGLFDELNELEEKLTGKGYSQEDIDSEIGDVFWYLCALCNEFNISFEEIVINHENLGNKYSPLKLFGVVKKYYRDNKKINPEFVSKCLLNFTYFIIKTANLSQDRIYSILEKNYNKLIARRQTNTLHGDGDNREKI